MAQTRSSVKISVNGKEVQGGMGGANGGGANGGVAFGPSSLLTAGAAVPKRRTVSLVR